VRDSKRLSPAQRARLAACVRANAVAWAIGSATVEEIDALNILHASLLAMRRALQALRPKAEFALIDGNRVPELQIGARAVVGGDATEAAISAASILAKTCRDDVMRELDREFPGYGFATHFGYPTPSHLERLIEIGPCPLHRVSFAPVREALLMRGQGRLW
jgi:ribonuclease HII